MPPQAQRSSRRPAPDTPSQPANLLDQLRQEQKGEGPAAPRDIIPVWAVITVFAAVWVLVFALMSPGWTDDFNSYLARARQNRRDHAGAIAPMSKLVAKYPKNITYQGELAQNYYETKQYDKALQHFLEAQRLSEEAGPQSDDDGKPLPSPDYNTMIGLTYFRMGDLANAEAYLEKGLKRDRLDKFANLTMGELEFQRKNFKKAMSYFKVVAAEPGFKEAVKGYYEQIEKELFAKVD